MTKASKEDTVVLEKVLCIYYPLFFCKDKKNKLRTLINLGSKVNAMTLMDALKLGFKIRRTNVKA